MLDTYQFCCFNSIEEFKLVGIIIILDFKKVKIKIFTVLVYKTSQIPLPKTL